MKRTNIVIDEALVSKVKSATGIKTTKELVDVALKELLRHKRQKEILKLKGHVDWEGDLSDMRKGRIPS